MTDRTRKFIRWGAIGNFVALIALLFSQNVIIAPWNILHRDAMEQHQAAVEVRLDKMSHDIALIMGALGVKDRHYE